jgi:hypothetical protein
VLEHALNDSAPITVRRKTRDLATDGSHDEINVLSWDQFNYLLDHVVAVLIPDDTQDI